MYFRNMKGFSVAIQSICLVNLYQVPFRYGEAALLNVDKKSQAFGSLRMKKLKKSRTRGMEAENGLQRNVEKAAEIFGRYGDDIQAMIRFQVQDESRIDDIFQDLFLSLVSNPVPAGVSNIKAYLYRAVTRDVIDSGRRARTYQDLPSRIVERREYVTVEQSADSTTIEVEELQKLSELIKENLPPCQADAVTLTYIDDLDAGEAAMRMGVNKRTVHRYKCVGLRKVRKRLKQEGFLEQYYKGLSR